MFAASLLSVTLLATTPQVARCDSMFAQLPELHARRLAGAITVDGLLNEPEWQTGEPITRFIQGEPNEAAAPTQKTEVRIAYDDVALYVGARMYDAHPDSIIARLSRRDVSVPTDKFSVFVDPFHDKRSGYYFQVTAAGTQLDGTLYNTDWDESSWDGVWEGAAHVDAQGWTCEMRIPFSQLRFQKRDQYVWGINLRRDIQRTNERDWVVFVPKNSSGFVSRFPTLLGIEKVAPGRFVEILPYVTSRGEYLVHDHNDPFNDGSRYKGEMGGDLRAGLGSNLTLNATVNPDFGQVEVDPAVVNLSDVETFFSEKRPFFVEGSTIYNFGNQGANNYWGFNWPEPKFFYTRRIGRSPEGAPPDSPYVDAPTGTRILGAAKLTGKVLDGWNIGTLHAVTERTDAELAGNGPRTKAEIEPLTYYGVERGLRDFNHGRQGLGLMTTYVARQFDSKGMADQLNRESFMGGVDGWTFLDKSKTWVVSGWSVVSQVRGTQARMTALQQNSIHYFQRPDSKYLEVDSTATSLNGMGTRLWLNKQNGRVIFNSAAGFQSPNFDVNDLGFQTQSGVYNAHVGGGYKWNDVGRYKRSSSWIGALFGNMNFDHKLTNLGAWTDQWTQFRGNIYWENTASINPRRYNDRLTRGGPLLKMPTVWEIDEYVESDPKRSRYYSLTTGFNNDETNAIGWWFNPAVEFKPVSNIVFKVSPGFSKNREDAHYIGVYDDPLATSTYGKRYVMATLDETTLSTNITLNWSFTPKLCLQMFVQPLVASGAYHNYKELTEPGTYDFLVYGRNGSTFDPNGVVADPDGAGPAAPINIGNQDFNFRELRGNAVLRWEYMPGSALFLVWTQDRTDSEDIGQFEFNHSFHQLVTAKANNIFLVKASYYFNL
ncbi:MAG TPA: DUF5916 domain-containing protein [Candidatus Saccharimonadaceae bacterium]|jgi:hypothetical protein|nr:DUF5916 domain-containing protein [Candidatus Saccharimonadaceae bacterium]